MKPIAESMTINASRETVFAVCSNIRNSAEFISGISQVEIVSGQQVGVGTRWKETRTVLGREHTEEMWITHFEPPTRYCVEAENCGAKYLTEFQFRDLGPRQTELTICFAAQPLTMMAKMMSPLSGMMAGTLQKMLAQDLADIKRHAEAINED